jgi:hypothetical protein
MRDPRRELLVVGLNSARISLWTDPTEFLLVLRRIEEDPLR